MDSGRAKPRLGNIAMALCPRRAAETRYRYYKKALAVDRAWNRPGEPRSFQFMLTMKGAGKLIEPSITRTGSRDLKLMEELERLCFRNAGGFERSAQTARAPRGKPGPASRANRKTSSRYDS